MVGKRPSKPKRSARISSREAANHQPIAGGQKALQAYLDRITQLKVMNSNLESAMLFRQAILDAMNVMVVATDERGKISFTNLMAQRKLAFSAEEVIGQTPLLFQPKDIVSIPQDGPIERFSQVDPSYQEFFVQSILRFPGTIFCSILSRDKSRFPAKVTIFPLSDSPGKLTGYLGIVLDLSGMDRAESNHLVEELHILGLLKLNQMSEFSVEEIIHFALEEGIRLTRSRLGFIKFLGNSGNFFLFAANATGGVGPANPDISSEFQDAITEIIGETKGRKTHILMEEMLSFPPKSKRTSGKPIILDNGFCTPIFYCGKLVCVAGVANRDGRYEAAEIQKFTLLLDNMARVVSLKQAELGRERLRADLEKAREQEMLIGFQIQKLLLMGKPPRGIKGAKIGSVTIPSIGVDGDFFDFFKLSQFSFDVLVGDVMGKGVPAALMGAAAKSQFQRALNRLLLFFPRNVFPTPEDIMAKVHSEITPQLSSLDSFISLHFARFDMKQRHVFLINCGHTMIIHFHHISKSATLIPGNHPPLGINPSEVYRQIRVPFETGDIFVIFSDGVTDARNAAGNFFGTKSLVRLVEQHYSLKPTDLIKEIINSVVSFSGAKTFDDDLTLVVISANQ